MLSEISEERQMNVRVDRRIRFFELFLFVTIFLFAMGAGMCVSLANSPAPASYLTVLPENVPEEAVYLDLLIPMPLDDPHYRRFNQTAADGTGLPMEAPIVRYLDDEGYVSYSFHMADAASRMKLVETENRAGGFEPLSFGDNAYAGSETHLQYIQKNFGSVKAALLDDAGNVIAVSDAASVTPGKHAYLTGRVVYDCASGRLSPDVYKGSSAGYVALYGLLLLISLVMLAVRAVFTGAVETVAALFFRVGPKRTVFLVNIVSNIVFNVLLFAGVFVIGIPYLALLVVGELGVVWAEYRIYRRRLVSCGKKRILAFTIAANLASLLLGIGMNVLLPGIGIYFLDWLV